MCYVHYCLPLLFKETVVSIDTLFDSTKKNLYFIMSNCRGQQEKHQIWHCFSSKILSLNPFWEEKKIVCEIIKYKLEKNLLV